MRDYGARGKLPWFNAAAAGDYAAPMRERRQLDLSCREQAGLQTASPA